MNKALTIALLTGAAVLAADAYATNYEVSRNGKNVKYVFQISAQGSHTPAQSLSLAKNPDEEPKQLNYVTPLGIRQQYMIGNELRYRYIEETKDFLDDLYNITQPFLQTSWNDTSILSAQAMMLGIYPPKKNNYVLEEHQKYNAVPPIEGFDFKPWIDEMGLEALPYQTTIFPIQMNGWSYDYMLALDDINCPARAAARSTVDAQRQQAIKDTITQKLPDMMTYVDKYGFENTCGYVTWAWTESVDLADSVEAKTPLDKMHDACLAAQAKVLGIYNTLESSKLNQVTSNDVRKRIMNQIFYWIQTNPTTPPAKVEEMKQLLNGISLTTTAGSENPNYVLFWTNEDLLSLFSMSLSGDSKVAYPLVPSSTILLEFTMDASNTIQVAGFINDQEVGLVHCGGQTSCSAESFAKSIKDSLKVSDVAAWCSGK